MIPTLTKIDKFKYFLLPFRTSVWIWILISPIYFAIVLKVSNFSKSSFGDYLLKAFMMIFDQSINIKTTSFIYFLIIWFNFITSILYITHLGSFLTNTVDKTRFPILCPETRIKSVTHSKIHLENLIKVNYSDYMGNLHSTNLAYGYCISSIYWESQRGKSERILFKIVGSWSSSFGDFLRINKSSNHFERFNQFMVTSFTFGFIEKWNSETKNLNHGMIQEVLKSNDPILRFKDFKFHWTVLGTGWTVACGFLFLEILCVMVLNKVHVRAL